MSTLIIDAIDAYLENIHSARSMNTCKAYTNALRLFKAVLKMNDLSLTSPLKELPEISIAWFAYVLKDYSPSTERLYLCATAGLFEFITAEGLASPNLPKVRLIIRQRMRRSGIRLPQFPRNNIELIIDNTINIAKSVINNEKLLIRNLRDCAFLITLADTGLRVHEICKLRRGDIDWNEGKAIIIGKGDQQAIVRFSSRALKHLKKYLNLRASLDGVSGRPLSSLPVFARHDRGAGKKVKPITTTTGRNIVTKWVEYSLGKEASGSITPHSFRHYFVTVVLKSSGGNLKLAQELARHKNISVTQRYAHLSDDELDQGYSNIFG